MIDLEKFPKHLSSLYKSEWDKLFNLLPEIEHTGSFGKISSSEKTFPHWDSSEMVDKTLNVIYELNLLPNFDWSKWKKGRFILNDINSNYEKLDTITLCKLLTIIIRSDRFNEGSLISSFEKNIVTKIIKGLKVNIKLQHNQRIAYSIKSVLFGVAIGDAIGVPVEFKSRQLISKKPVTDMIGYGTYNLPAGTFSDDASLTFCLAEALTQEFDLNIIGQNFIKWLYDNFWTATGSIFDVGFTTRQAIQRLVAGEKPDFAGSADESSNGNGSLMRISPLLFYLLDKPIDTRYEITKRVSSITHRHIHSVNACFYYLEFARQLFYGVDKFLIYKNMQTEITAYLNLISIDYSEITVFDRLLKQNIIDLKADQISSSGYVIHTLEASIWCLLTTDNYKDAVLKAVNLGEDTDTTGAVTGGLAGLLYGFDNIHKKWIRQIARKDDIDNLTVRLTTNTST